MEKAVAMAVARNAELRRAVNLTIRADLIAQAKEMRLNLSQAAEAGIEDALQRARAEAWQRENKEAIDEYNERVDSGFFGDWLDRF